VQKLAEQKHGSRGTGGPQHLGQASFAGHEENDRPAGAVVRQEPIQCLETRRQELLPEHKRTELLSVMQS
jgi:hypothetical protein